MVKILKNNLPAIFLAFISIFICFTNYTPSTILSGWDTLHPEFNFGLAIKRELFGVFRAYQGLGAVAAHSDMADLPRIILLFFLSPFIPMSFLRYFYVFLNLIVGPLGIYYFLKRVVFAKSSNNTIPSFLGGLFYLLNLGTMQQFAVPFEMFTTQYATLPWLFLFATEYLQSKIRQKKTLVFFAITTLFAAPMAYAATLWYVYFIAFIVYLGLFILFLQQKKQALLEGVKKALILILLTLLINSFWILPNIYFVLNHASEVTNANINKLFSPQAFLYNKEFGNIKDIALLKSFLFDWNVYSGNDKFIKLLSPWITHLSSPFVIFLGFLFALISSGGIIYSILKKNKILISFLPLLFLCLFFLFNDNFPTSPFYRFLSDKIPFFKEAFRFPQDKVLGIFTFVFAIYFAAGQFLLASLYKRIKHAQIIISIVLLACFMLPAFKGNFISPYMRIKIPEYYFDMFKWFDKEPPDGRIANLPIHSLWGWDYYEWYQNENNPPTGGQGFQGAGFVWFGIKQPFLARDFDRWTPYNEQYYKEMSYAIYSQNPVLLKATIEKYNIKYLLFDKTIIDPQSDPKVLLHKETQKLLEEQSYIKKEKEFGDNLIVYKVNLNTPNNHFIVPIDYVFPRIDATQDFAYINYGNYISEKDKYENPMSDMFEVNKNEIVINLPKEKNGLDNELIIPADLVVKKEKNQQLSVIFNILNSSENTIIKPIPPSIKEDFILSVNKKDNFVINKINTSLLLGTVYLNKDRQNTIAIYPKKSSQKILPDFTNLLYSLDPCNNATTKGLFGTNEVQEKNSISLFAKNKEVCLTIPLKDLLKDKKTGPETLLGLELDYETNMPVIGFCLSRSIKDACTDYGLRNQPNLGSVLEYFALENPIENESLRFYQNTNSNNIEKVLYKNISLSLNSPIFSSSFSTNIDSMNPKPKLNIPLLKLGVGELSNNITKNSEDSNNCNNASLVNPFLLKKQTLDKTQDHFIQYFSLDETICDRFSYGDLSQNQAFLILITSRNVNGLPLSICVKNHVTKHCDIYSNLSSSSDFITNTFLLPQMIKNETGYDIIISTLGIGKTQSINYLKSIQVIPLPYKWLMEAMMSNLESRKKPVNVLILPQSFENGWKAYRINVKCHPFGPLRQSFSEASKLRIDPERSRTGQMSNVKCFIQTSFPFIFGEELKDHVLVNGWANGWKINNLTMQQFNNRNNLNNETIVFLFFPQYLEYLGFAFLGTTFLWLAYSIIKERRTSL